jgi:hypothetical protein
MWIFTESRYRREGRGGGRTKIESTQEFVDIVDANILQHRPKSMKQLPPLEKVQLNTKSNVSIVGTVNTINANPTSTPIPSTPTNSVPPTPTTPTTIESLNISDAHISNIGSSTNIPVSPGASAITTNGPNAVPSIPSDTDPGKVVTVLAPKNLERYL